MNLHIQATYWDKRYKPSLEIYLISRFSAIFILIAAFNYKMVAIFQVLNGGFLSY
jgi:hypothetical protein